MSPDERTPLLRVRPRDVADCALVVGDPQRVVEVAQFLENADEIGFYREYRTITGEYSGKKVTISSHGVGGAGANVCFDELFKCGVRNVIRAGTCGAMKEGIQDGELIIATGAIREDGASEHMAPMSFPAVADRHIIRSLENSALKFGYPKPNVGLVLTQGYFYPGILPSAVDFWLPTGLVICVEMELATLLVMAGLQGVRAGGIFTSDGNLTEEPDPNTYDTHRDEVDQGKTKMLQIALDALTRLSD